VTTEGSRLECVYEENGQDSQPVFHIKVRRVLPGPIWLSKIRGTDSTYVRCGGKSWFPLLDTPIFYFPNWLKKMQLKTFFTSCLNFLQNFGAKHTDYFPPLVFFPNFDAEHTDYFFPLVFFPILAPKGHTNSVSDV